MIEMKILIGVLSVSSVVQLGKVDAYDDEPSSTNRKRVTLKLSPTVKKVMFDVLITLDTGELSRSKHQKEFRTWQ